MRVRSILATSFVLAAATVIAVAATQLRGPRGGVATPQVNENSTYHLPVPLDLPIVAVEDAS